MATAEVAEVLDSFMSYRGAGAVPVVFLHANPTSSRTHPDYAGPHSKVDAIVVLLHSGQFPLLE